MAEVDLKHAVEKLGAETVKAKTEGLEDLKHILRQHKGTQRLKPLRDDAYHGIFEAVFHLVHSDKLEYLRTTLSRKKATLAARLATSASVLRYAVEIGVSVISHKTTTAVIDHIRDTLPISGEGYCAPLRNDYLKSLRAILEYPCHVEHLRTKNWQSLSDFLLAGITHGYAEEASNKDTASTHTESQEHRNSRNLSVRTSQASNARSLGSQSINSSAELITSLSLLTGATNAPLMTRARSILFCLINFLEHATVSQNDAFIAVNSVLAKAITEDVSLARSAVFGLVPIIRRLWQTKSSVVKDQMIVTLTLGREILSNQGSTRLTDNERLSLCNLFDVLAADYQRRTDREILHMDDIRFTDANAYQPLGLQGIVPVVESGRALSTWSVVDIIATLAITIDGFGNNDEGAGLLNETPRKRRKMNKRTDDIVNQALASSGPEKAGALQILIFLMKDSESVTEAIVIDIIKFVNGILDDDSTVASWSMLLFAQLTHTRAASRPELKRYWLLIWQWSARSLSTLGTSRAACSLLEAVFCAQLLDAAVVAETVSATLFSDSLSSFCGLTDSSLSLWLTVLRSRLSDDPASADKVAMRTVHWLAANWNMSSVLDRLQNAQTAFHAQPDMLVRLLTTCTEKELSIAPVTPKVITSKIYHTHFRISRDEQFIKYLIGSPSPAQVAEVRKTHPPTAAASEQLNGHLVERTILEMLLAKLKAFRDAWLMVVAERASNINSDMVYIIASLCVVTKVFFARVNRSDAAALKEVGRLSEQMWEMVSTFISQQEADAGHRLLPSMASALLAIQPTDAHEQRIVQRSLSTLSATVLNVLQRTLNGRGVDDVLHQDSIDMEDSLISEASQMVTESLVDGPTREDFPFSCDERSALVRMSIELFLTQALANEQNESDASTCSTVVDFFVSLPAANLLAARQPIVEFLSKPSSLTRTDAARVLVKLAAGCMQDDNFERCEASLCLCLDAMTALVNLWTSDDEDDLTGVASDMYAWFLDIALGKGLASSNVLKGITRMLEAVLETNDLFHRTASLRSPRTSLFHILRAGDNSVKFYVAGRICRIFDRFVLTEHEAILDDVVECLPSDPDNVEGIAVRLFVLTDLAAKWNTLLRRCMYHVFETAAQVPQSVLYAQVCLRKLCQALALSSPREIFLLFCPQILYTWLDNEPIDSIPFAIYGFDSLTDLLSAAQLELVGQIAMRGSAEQAKIVSETLGIPWESLLRASFTKAEAYTIARDISMPPREHSTKSTESLLRKQLGNESYIRLVGDLFPDIIATLFISLGEEHGIERAFSKRHGFDSAKATLLAITSLSHSEVVLPVSQQPTFRAKFLLDELSFLCQRIDLDLESIWDSSLVVHICRTLLDSAVPALGSLYASTVFRKLRIVVSIAPSTVLRGYPIEMLLHALRPYLTIFHCSEDALGLFWFLLDRGKVYLQTRPSFMIGLAVATFISLTKFLNSTQESTTQESHFLAIMSKAQSFHQWFGEYLDSFEPSGLGRHERDAFQRFVHAARQMTRLGSAVKGSHEGDLMLELFDDHTSNRRLLSEASFTLAFELVCSSFEAPANPREDILGDDSTAVLHAPVIWDIILHLKADRDFQIWAAQTLGRAYAATGTVSDKLSREQDLASVQPARDELRPGGSSDNAILQRLQAMLFTTNQAAVGQAEKTLQMIITQLHLNGTIGLYEGDIDAILAKDLQWSLFSCPSSISMPAQLEEKSSFPRWDSQLRPEEWASQVALALCLEMRQDPILWALRRVVSEQPHFAEQVLPAVVHKVLLSESDSHSRVSRLLSDLFSDVLTHHDTLPHQQVSLIHSIVLYLRGQPLPRESTMADRSSWLNIDLGVAAAAAAACQAHKTAILFLELQDSQRHLQSGRASRRSSAAQVDDPAVLMQSIFQELDDPDFFYGVQEKASIASVLRKLDHEGAGLQKLSFQSAMYDSSLKCSADHNETPGASGIMSALSAANLDGLARAVQVHQRLNDDKATTDSVLSIGLNLHHWDLPALPSIAPSTKGAFLTFRQLSTSHNHSKIVSILNRGLLDSLNQIEKARVLDRRIHQAMSTLTMLTEVKETLASHSTSDVNNEWQRMIARTKWMKFESFERSRPIILGREALFSAIRRNDYLQSTLKISPADSQLFEVKVVRESFRVAGQHDALQSALNRAMYLADLASLPPNRKLKIESVAQYDLAKILWDLGQTTTSIQMLRQLKDRDDIGEGAFGLSRSEILAELGQRTAEARLSKPDEIIAQCLVPAIKELNGRSQGIEAGRVFHDFAAFCDLQLQNPDDKDDFHRIETIRHRKEKEIQDLQRMIEQADRKTRAQLEQHQTSAKRWFKLDNEEYQRLQSARHNLIQQSLENYLLSLRACDEYRNDVLRFCALWLDQSGSEQANAAVGRHIAKVASRKFAPLMSQLASRLLDEEVDFQLLLSDLLYRICCDHPYHGMYQVFVGSKTKGARTDEIAASRNAAASKLAKKLIEQPSVSKIWVAVHNSSIAFVHFAQERLEEKKHKAGAKASLHELQTGPKLVQAIEQSSTKIPPPTMKIALRNDCKYSSLPTIAKLEPLFSIAGGVSAPKIITVIGTDGQRYKMLLKGGNDDLRQDSIMEQVFEQVSNLLQDHRATRQRQLGIRTYKVLPLTQNAGIIEFVKNTIPLHEYSLPAHQRYFPKDYKPSRCRKEIAEAQTKSLSQRLQAYRNVTNNFHPVLRFFLMEHFLNPDDWFTRRLAYSRSTAAISILGYVLGLGDRHGHNILLDEHTGEVVHIDLGVAFEAGRVLPVPETVPFRLTRDIVDGMGLSGVEGVFRRCCNFTLEALRQDQYSIMTILDVLRYDPLYSWSVSPLRLQRMQENQGVAEGDPTATSTLGKNRDPNEPSEADRALTVVGKKLGKSLSVEATVNELIQQATDERNLATLYCGWSAYA